MDHLVSQGGRATAGQQPQADAVQDQPPGQGENQESVQEKRRHEQPSGEHHQHRREETPVDSEGHHQEGERRQRRHRREEFKEVMAAQSVHAAQIKRQHKVGDPDVEDEAGQRRRGILSMRPPTQAEDQTHSAQFASPDGQVASRSVIVANNGQIVAQQEGQQVQPADQQQRQAPVAFPSQPLELVELRGRGQVFPHVRYGLGHGVQRRALELGADWRNNPRYPPEARAVLLTVGK